MARLQFGQHINVNECLCIDEALEFEGVDDAVFLSVVSLALYLLPALFAVIGIYLVSHVLVRPLMEAEKQFEKENPRSD